MSNFETLLFGLIQGEKAKDNKMKIPFLKRVELTLNQLSGLSAVSFALFAILILLSFIVTFLMFFSWVIANLGIWPFLIFAVPGLIYGPCIFVIKFIKNKHYENN